MKWRWKKIIKGRFYVNRPYLLCGFGVASLILAIIYGIYKSAKKVYNKITNKKSVTENLDKVKNLI